MFCTTCGAAVPADAKFCPSCGKAVAATAAPAPATAAQAPTKSTPVAAPPPAAATGSLDLANPKTQVEVAFGFVAAVLVIFFLIGVANTGGNGLAVFFALIDLGLAGYCLWGWQLTRQRKFAAARNTAIATAGALVILGVVAIALYGSAGGLSLVITLLLAAVLGFAYLRLGTL